MTRFIMVKVVYFCELCHRKLTASAREDETPPDIFCCRGNKMYYKIERESTGDRKRPPCGGTFDDPAVIR
jgi:hypothetical protein